MAKRAEFKGTRDEMFNNVLAQVKSDKVDQEALNTFFESKEVEMKEMHSFFVSKFAEFHGMLTAEQRTKLAGKMEEFHEKMHR